MKNTLNLKINKKRPPFIAEWFIFVKGIKKPVGRISRPFDRNRLSSFEKRSTITFFKKNKEAFYKKEKVINVSDKASLEELLNFFRNSYFDKQTFEEWMLEEYPKKYFGEYSPRYGEEYFDLYCEYRIKKIKNENNRISAGQ